ncbi:hypothetical protein LCGC14_2848850 [marine sediment metagenome]|uniref:Uncharacterized protein n=1 Tax=marine sediment metagenome TaxID=412755 RepID=A0A0F9AHD1_9ZZZZ
MIDALFRVRKNGGDVKEFSTKKTIAVVVCLLAIISTGWLIFFPSSHWITALSGAGVSDGVIITAQASLDALSCACLSVYGIAKARGAA